MTTYTITGFKVIYSGVDAEAVQETTMTIVAPDALDRFIYSTPLGTEPDFFSVIELLGLDPYNFYFDDVPKDEVFTSNFDEVYAGFINLGSGNSYFIDFEDFNDDEDYFFQMGGVPFPAISSLSEYTALLGSVTDGGAITSGVFAAGEGIELAGFTNVAVTQRDIIRGDASANVFYGGLGRDKIIGAAGDDTLYGNEGRDKILAGKGNDNLFGGKFADQLFGASNNDAIFGGRGNDYLDGGAGRDRLNGGLGNDFHYGDAGRDTIVFSGAADQGSDTVGDFQDGFDMIEIGGTVRYGGLTIMADGMNTVITWRDTMLTLLDTDVALIDMDDFSFV